METKNSQRLMHIAVTNHWKIKEKWLTPGVDNARS